MADWFSENAPATPAEAAVLAQVRARESGGDYTARNPKPGSTASGAHQFINSTWQMATEAAGLPAYRSAAEAPQAIQDANALYMLRKYGPNSTITWAASGPYKQSGTVTGPAASTDVLAKIASGDITPEELAQSFQQPPRPAPVAQPVAEPATAAGPVQPRDWFAKNAPPSPPPPPTALDEAKRLGSIAAGASGLTAAKDILASGAKTVMDFLVGNPVNPQDVEKFNSSLLGLEHGIYGELPRSGQQLVESLKAFGRGDINSAADHLWFSIPFLGAAGQQMKEYLDRGDVTGALAHAAGSLAPIAHEPVMSAVEALPGTVRALPETVSRTAEATRAGLRAAAPDVTQGTVKVGVATGASYLPIPGPVKYGFGIPTAAAGAKQIVGGLKAGVEAARASFAETAPAAATEAGAGFAVPKEPPITAPTDEALVHLYSVETDPVKRSALQAELIDRGLMKAEPAATVAPEANPYRDYSQNALQRVYALERDATKRALIEQAARDRNLTLLNREGRRASVTVPETGAAEARGPSLTQDDALMLRYLGETDPLQADAETIGIARKLAADNPELLAKLRAAGSAPEPLVSQPTPAEQAVIAQPATAQAEGTLEYNAPGVTPAQAVTPPAPTLSFDDLATSLTGKSPSKLTVEDRAAVQNVYDRITKGLPQETPPTAPQAAPVTPEAPAATAEPSPAPIAPEPPQAHKTATQELAEQLENEMRVERLTDYAIRKKIPADVLGNFQEKHWQAFAEDAGTQAPTPEQAAQIQANVEAKSVNGPPAVKEAAFQEQKAAIESGMTPPQKTPPAAPPAAPGGVQMQPLPEHIPPHYLEHYTKQGLTVTERDFAKDLRISDYVLNNADRSILEESMQGKGITPEEFEALPLDKQNKLIQEAPTASGRGKHYAYSENPGPGKGRPAAVGIRHITDTMRWRQAQSRIEPNAGQSSPAANVPATAQSVPQPRLPGSDIAPATETVIRIPGEQRTFPARYVVRELDDVQPSHNPFNFEKNPQYHYRNDRNYSDPANQERIVINSQAGRFDPANMLLESPDAVNGAPVIDSSGNVLGGNSRAMILNRVYQNNPAGAAAYRQMLEQRAPLFGYDPAAVAKMKRPILVREMQLGENTPQSAITDLNKTGTAQLTAVERATADARRMSAGAADYLAQAIDAEGPDATLSDLLSGKQGSAVINKLVDDGVITMQEKPALVDARTGAITAAGKERISKMLLGQVFEDADQMIRTAPEIRNKLERAVSPILQSSQKVGFDIRPTVRSALDLIEYARAHGMSSLNDVMAQESMFGSGPQFSPEALRVAEFLRDNKPTAIGQAFRRYVANAEPTMFGASNPAEAFQDAFGMPEKIPEVAPPAPKRRSKAK